MSIIKPIIKKIPGEVPPLPKKSSQGYIDDLGKKTKIELQELLERQNKLLANKSFVSKLPDKGAKIICFKEKLSKELEHRNHVEGAAKLLSRLNIASEGKAAMSKLEWTGEYSEKAEKNGKIVELDSDDDNENVLKILAQPTGSGVHKKKVIHLAQEESLIKPEDLVEIESASNDNIDVGHIKYIVNKVENSENKKKKEPFRPYKTTKSNVHDPEKEIERGKKKHFKWEVTAATPPTIVHGAVKPLSIEESLELQKEQTAKLKVIQAKSAAERLVQQLGTHTIGNLPRNAGNYRSHTEKSDSSSSEDEEDYEVYDDEDNDRGGTVTYTVDTVES
ncbi:DNA-directed RNA polymerase II subunit GRINL1A [Copidosoma floridanum]|uniref:DNA-directed RNA polymerase II subunit GRINL1A n=1 Tax=Copidosoma floridanum TaxID=29053 RepID=UPI0006C95E27|nr:DNA-directed RNA polymerase II subunit GRINL1A [Copidosoma floridanum]